MKTKALITIQVPRDLKKTLVNQAVAEEIDLSKLCRRILKRHLAATPPPAAPASEHPKAA